MMLEGDYESVRQFLYELETTPEFIIVDDVTPGAVGREQAGDADGRSVHVLPAGTQWNLDASAR